MSDLGNILSSGQGQNEPANSLSEEMLMDYLEGRLTPEQQHEVELWLDAQGMEGDAIEGLRQVLPGEARQSVYTLNQRLKKQLANKKFGRKGPMSQSIWGWIAVVIVLLICIASFLVIRLALK